MKGANTKSISNLYFHRFSPHFSLLFHLFLSSFFLESHGESKSNQKLTRLTRLTTKANQIICRTYCVWHHVILWRETISTLSLCGFCLVGVVVAVEIVVIGAHHPLNLSNRPNAKSTKENINLFVTCTCENVHTIKPIAIYCRVMCSAPSHLPTHTLFLEVALHIFCLRFIDTNDIFHMFRYTDTAIACVGTDAHTRHSQPNAKFNNKCEFVIVIIMTFSNYLEISLWVCFN